MRYASFIWLLLCATSTLYNLGENSEFYSTAKDHPTVWIFPSLRVTYLVFVAIFLWKLPKIMKQKHSVENFLRDFRCRLLPNEGNEHILDYVKQVSNQYAILNPQIYITESIKNNSFSISDGESSVIIISYDIIEKLDSVQIESILRHELYHLKFFTINKFEHITRPELTSLKVFCFVMVLPLLVITFLNDYFFTNYYHYENANYLSTIVFVFLAAFYKLGIYFYMSQTSAGSVLHSTNTSELLADAFSVLHNRHFDDLKSAIIKIKEQRSEVPILSNIYECFVSRQEHDSLEILEEQQRKRKEHIEATGWRARLRQEEWQFVQGPYNNWVDIVHESTDGQGNAYSDGVRLQLINDLQTMCNHYVKINIAKSSKNNKTTGRWKGDIYKSDLWRVVFKSHQIPDEKVMDALFSYFKTHENNFNLIMCAKELGLPEFTVFLGLARHIFYRNILLKWRYPIKFNFDY